MEAIIDIDSSIFLFFNGMHNSFFDTFMSMFSGRYIWVAMYASMLYVMLRRFNNRQLLILAVAIALTILAADQICASLLRPVFERLRPSNLLNPISQYTHIVNDYRGGAYGFPSCHAANSFALATFTALMFRNRSYTLFIFFWAVLNSYSRIYLGVHYPGDLIVGAAIGSLIAIGLYFAAKACCNAAGQPLKPCRCPVGINAINVVYVVGVLTLLYILTSAILSVIG